MIEKVKKLYKSTILELNDFIDIMFLKLWDPVYELCKKTGELWLFAWESLQLFFVKPFRANEIIKQM